MALPVTDVDEIRSLADALVQAERQMTPIAPVRDALSSGDASVETSYIVQEFVVQARESSMNPRVGRKVGLTSASVREQLGVNEPDFGVLLKDMAVPDGGTLDLKKLIAPRVEAEIAFVMANDVHDATPENVIDSVDYVVAALEIVDSRIKDWDIAIFDTIADNASNSRFVVGTNKVSLNQVTPSEVEMALYADGALASSGVGRDCLGDPLNALVWVARNALSLGRPLRAGELVLSGALGPLVPLRPNMVIRAEFSGLGHVSMSTMSS